MGRAARWSRGAGRRAAECHDGGRVERDWVHRYIPRSFGDVAQLGERRVRNAKVEGSIPFVSTKEPTRPAISRVFCRPSAGTAGPRRVIQSLNMRDSTHAAKFPVAVESPCRRWPSGCVPRSVRLLHSRPRRIRRLLRHGKRRSTPSTPRTRSARRVRAGWSSSAVPRSGCGTASRRSSSACRSSSSVASADRIWPTARRISSASCSLTSRASSSSTPARTTSRTVPRRGCAASFEISPKGCGGATRHAHRLPVDQAEPAARDAADREANALIRNYVGTLENARVHRRAFADGRCTGRARRESSATTACISTGTDTPMAARDRCAPALIPAFAR